MSEEDLSEVERIVLIHIYKYGPDSPWLIARRALGGLVGTKLDETAVEQACRRLIDLGLLTLYRGDLRGLPTSSVKPWLKVKSKRPDAKVRGLYCQLTKKGKGLASRLYKSFRDVKAGGQRSGEERG